MQHVLSSPDRRQASSGLPVASKVTVRNINPLASDPPHYILSNDSLCKTFVMAEEKVIVPTRDEIRVLGLDSENTHDLIRQAQEADAADRRLTIKEAIKKYKKACFWAMILSTSLVMEGYDLVIVSGYQ